MIRRKYTSVLIACFLCFLFYNFHSTMAFLPPFASTFDVVEECPSGTLIHGVADYLKRIVLLSVEMPNSTTYQLMGLDTLTKSFVINSKSGELRTIGRIDRETICTDGDGNHPSHDFKATTTTTELICIKAINILIKSHTTSMRQQVMLRIIDINDNAPYWPEKRALTVRFVEAFQSSSGSYGKQDFSTSTESQLLDRAIDLDAGLNGSLSYTLKGIGSERFRLENADLKNRQTDHGDADGPLRLKPVVPLDREMAEFYNLTLCAYDSGTPQKSTCIPLNVHITDVNDHAPIFLHNYISGHLSTTYSHDSKQGELVKYTPERGHLMETARIGSVVLQLNATDEDSDDNARITYSIFPGDVALVQAYFNLDPITGHLTVRQRLDYDSGPRRFTFKVLAVDGAPEPYRLTGTALVDIELTDYNDEPPNIEILIAQNGNSNAHVNGGITPIIPQSGRHQELVAFIEESPAPDIVIAYVQVSDKDENGEDQVECHLNPHDNFTLQADSISSSSLIKSDHFGFDTSALSERLPRRVNEYRVLAKVPSNADHSVSDSTNLQDRLDRETTPSQLLTIVCKDRNGNQAERRIRLHLLDINDNPPRFLNNSYFNFSIPENREPTGSQQVWLGRVQAVDADLGENARITYHLAAEPNTHQVEAYTTINLQQIFRIQPDTGDIYAQVSLDRENAPDSGIYSMSIHAVDHGKPQQLTGTAKVDVTVLDVNDWPPEFSRDIYTFEVPEDIALREIIGTVEAVDRDATADGSTITYHLNIPRGGVAQRSFKNESLERVRRDSQIQQQQPLFMPHLEPSKLRDDRPVAFFSIDSRTGDIRVIRKLDRETNGYYTFEILAVDAPLSGISATTQSPGVRRNFKGTDDVFTATATVIITLTDVNDNAPEFLYPNSSILLHMAPGETLGHKILTVQAVDADYGENARISYSIRSEIPIPQDGPGTGTFAIDETSGLIFLTRPIQGPVNHRLVIEACDHGVQPKCTISPAIQIAVSEDAKLVAGSGGGATSSGSPLNTAGSRSNDRHNHGAISNSDRRFNNFDGLYGNFYEQPPPHRVEVIAACLVVIFGVLLFAALVLVCLLKRRSPVTGQQRLNQQTQNQTQQQRFDYACTPLWNCQWGIFKHSKGTGKRSGQHYGTTQAHDALNDPRFSDGQSIESSMAKGMLSTDSITNALEEEKKPLYYDGLGVLALDAMAPRTLRHPVEYSSGGNGGNGGMPMPVVFTGSPPRVYGTLPVVSTILSDGQTAVRSGFHPRGNGGTRRHPTNITPPSPDYQSLDQLASRPVWQSGHHPHPHHGMDLFTTSPNGHRQVNNITTSTSNYGCLIDDTPRRNNYYEISTGNGPNRQRQRSATLGRLRAMTEEDVESDDGPIRGEKRRGVLGTGNNTTTRSYSQLQATNDLESGADDSPIDRDRPTRYTYQAIREASFV